jgi:predicted dehydrogenase
VTRIGIVGVGYWGPKLARNFHEIENAELAWICDLDESRLEHVRSLYPEARTTRSYREMLAADDVDAICVTTPVRTHSKLAIAALQAGKHVLVEKPLAASAVEAHDIVTEADRQGRIAMVGHTFIYNPAVTAMKQIIDSGELGEIYYIDGMRVNLGLFQPDINVAWDLAPHDISILLHVLGKDPLYASASGGAYVQRHRGIHDVVYLTLHFPNGVFANIRVSWLDPCKVRRHTVVGSRKMLVYDDVEDENKLLIFNKGVDLPLHSDTEEQFRLSYRSEDGIPYPVAWHEPLRAECQHFVDCIQGGVQPITNAREGLRVVQVLEAAQASLMNGGGREAVHFETYADRAGQPFLPGVALPASVGDRALEPDGSLGALFGSRGVRA